jgi:WD40 repeat protein
MSVLRTETLLNPTATEVDDGLLRAIALLTLQDPDVRIALSSGNDGFAASFDRDATGQYSWHDSSKYTSSGSQVPFVCVVWATDHGGRRTVRISAGYRRMPTGPIPVESVDELELPPVAVVFSEHAYLGYFPGWRERRALLACPCGVMGELDEIAWMGDRCGPCHDRTEAGEQRPALLGRDYLEIHLAERPAGTVSDERNEGRGAGRPLAVAPDGDVVVAPERDLDDAPDSEVALWNPETRLLHFRCPVRGHAGRVRFCADGRSLAILSSSGPDVYLGRYHLASGQRGPEIGPASLSGTETRIHPAWFPTYGPIGFAVTPDGAVFVSLRDGLYRGSFSRPGPLVGFLPSGGDAQVACSPDGTRLGILARDGSLTVVDPATGSVHVASRVSSGYIAVSLAFTPDGHYLLVADPPSSVTIFRVADLANLGTYSAGNHTVRDIQVSGPWLILLHERSNAISRWPLAPLLDFVRRQEGRSK